MPEARALELMTDIDKALGNIANMGQTMRAIEGILREAKVFINDVERAVMEGRTISET